MKILPFEKSFASHPKSAFWSDKNTLKPTQVNKGSHHKFWFDCNKCLHSFECSSLKHVTNADMWCSYCSSPPRKLCDDENCTICYEKSFASHPKSEFWSKKNTINPRQVFKSSSKVIIFDCICGHDFKSPIDRIYTGSWCPYCSSPPRKLCNDEKCTKCYEKSFASHPKSAFWSDTNVLKPRQVFAVSAKNYKFDCSNCGHEITKSPAVIKNGTWCLYCCDPRQELCKDENCTKCYENSFASHSKSAFWSKKNTVSPRQVLNGSNKMYLFDCDCGHEIKKAICDVTNDHWCKYCCRNPSLCEDEECNICFEKSFASHEFSKYWSLENERSPREVCKVSGKEYLFICVKGHRFSKVIANITKGLQECSVCAITKRYSMKACNWLDFIAGYYNIDIQHQKNHGEYKIPGTKWRVDGFCKSENTTFEFHGTIFHGDPRAKICQENETNYLGNKYVDLYKKTIERDDAIKNMGFKHIVMWELDWNNAIKLIKNIQKRFRTRLKHKNIN